MDERTSKVFDILKVFSMFFVFLAHFVGAVYPEIPIWLLASFALFIFGFSSAYFTSEKYFGNFSLKQYFGNKIKRLYVGLAVIFVFLGLLFFVEGRQNIFSFQSLMQYLGFGGILNWFSIENTSPFGAGMWFITLLLIFYLLFPILNRFIAGKIQTWTFMVLGIICLYVWSMFFYPGTSLFLTASAFILGFGFSRLKLKLSSGHALYLALLSVAFFGVYAFFVLIKFKQFNFFFQFFMYLCAMLFLLRVPLIIKLFNPISFLSMCLLEFYLIAPYLSFHLFNHLIVDLLFSIAIILPVSLALASISKRISKALFESG